MSVLTSLEAKEVPSACTVYNRLKDLWSYLKSGLSKSSFGVETDRLLAKYPVEQKRKHIKSFQNVFKLSLQKLEEHWDAHPACLYYEAMRIFDPRQMPTLGKDIEDYGAVEALQDPSPELLEEWLIYTLF